MNYKLINKMDNNLSAVEQILFNRGIAVNDITHYLNTTEADLLPPQSIARIKDGVCMLIKHIKALDNTFIIVDSDCDGYTSSALLINYINTLYPGYAQNYISYMVHEGKEHGIELDKIPTDVKLVIAPDSASNDYEQHKILKEKGIDVLVIDHHEAEYVSEDACIINNQMCDYPTKSLSGVGMVWKVCCYIDNLLNIHNADRFIDLASLGICADMMELKDFETRYIINTGFNNINNPFFKTMTEKQSFVMNKNGGVTPHTVAFYIAPLINALVRMGTLDEKICLFESMLDFKGYEPIPSTKRGCKGQLEARVDQACRNCNNAKTKQNKAIDESFEVIEQLIKNNNLLNNKILLIQLDKNMAIEKTITGLVANKLANLYQIPTLVLNKKDNDGIISWEGSARGYDKSEFKNFKDFINESNLCMYGTGHQNAFGCGILDKNINEFINYSNNKLKNYDFTPCYNVDLIWNSNNFNSDEILKIAELESIWGQGVEKPYIAIENIKLTKNNIQLLKGTTIKIVLDNGVSLIKFNESEETYNQLLPSDYGYTTISVIGTCNKNEWGNSITPQIMITDYEITNIKNYYF